MTHHGWRVYVGGAGEGWAGCVAGNGGLADLGAGEGVGGGG